jgi:NAD(P)-dependent dehydrogenase (short-subunit alcohol dehydrogenase family)
VILIGRDRTRLKLACETLGALSDYVGCDLALLDQLPAIVKNIKEKHGSIDILINNAGMHLKKPINDVTDEDFQKVILTNQTAMFSLTREVAKIMQKQCSGVVLNISSMASRYGIPYVVAYTASKSAIEGMTRAMAVELSPLGIRVNCIAPGFIKTDMSYKALSNDPERKKKIYGRTPLGRLGTAEEVADAAYFIGEDVPKMTGVCDPPLPQGYSYDYINSEVLQQRASVKDGRFVLPDGMSYRILVLPKLETMRPEMLLRIKELVEQGAVVLGPAPKRSPSLENYPEADLQVQKMAAEQWGKIDGTNTRSAKVGKGMILSGMDMQEALDLIKVLPDFRLAEGDTALFIHRNLGNSELYYISNQSENQININPEFRISGLSPELWDPVTGSVRDLPAYVQNENTTIVPLKLESFESLFIIFRKKAGKASVTDVASNFPVREELQDLNGPWNVTFNTAGRGPVKPVVFETLSDWITNNNDSIKYYSGTAFYQITFNMDQVDPGKKYFADLGTVKAMAKVKLNGKYSGGVWTAPWTADISDAIRAGENTLEVEVVNTWVNRLIGDSRLPAAERKTWCSVNPFKPDSQLDPSGLIGPVKIVSVR